MEESNKHTLVTTSTHTVGVITRSDFDRQKSISKRSRYRRLHQRQEQLQGRFCSRRRLVYKVIQTKSKLQRSTGRNSTHSYSSNKRCTADARKPQSNSATTPGAIITRTNFEVNTPRTFSVRTDERFTCRKSQRGSQADGRKRYPHSDNKQ